MSMTDQAQTLPPRFAAASPAPERRPPRPPLPCPLLTLAYLLAALGAASAGAVVQAQAPRKPEVRQRVVGGQVIVNPFYQRQTGQAASPQAAPPQAGGADTAARPLRISRAVTPQAPVHLGTPLALEPFAPGSIPPDWNQQLASTLRSALPQPLPPTGPERLGRPSPTSDTTFPLDLPPVPGELADGPLSDTDLGEERRDHLQPQRQAADAGGADVILFSAKSVELEIPPDWFVTEVPIGREVRLVLSPQKLPPMQFALPELGIWVASRPRSLLTAPESALELASQRITQLVHDARPLAARETRFSGLPAIQIDFQARGHRVPPAPSRRRQLRVASGSNRPAPDRSAATESYQGSYVLVDSEWGWTEFLAIAPQDQWPHRGGQLQQILATARLGPPQFSGNDPRPELTTVAGVLGSWKAYRSRLRLHGTGRVELVHDRPISIEVERRYGVTTLPTRKTLTGSFRARRDLLEISWDDGSRLNYRWQIDGDRLLLTDHEGLVSQLNRLHE